MQKVILALILACLSVPAAYGQQSGRAMYTRYAQFKIPFQMAEGEEATAIKEIQLYVAKNRGAWELYTAVSPSEKPDQRFFQFQASGDGEYWFAVRTVDRQGNAVPAKISELQPELRVIVDTTQPEITLTPLPRDGNTVAVKWRIREPHLKFDSFKLEYRVGEQGRWIAVPSAVFRIAGEARWEVSEQGTVYVRAQIQDQAHNLGIAQCQIPASVEAPGTSDPAVPAQPPQVDPVPSALPDVTTTAAPATPAAPQPAMSPPAAPTAQPSSTLPPTAASAMPGPKPTNSSTGAVQQSAAETPLGMQTTPTTNVVPRNRTIVRHAAINIDYAVEDVGPSGIGSVQLWYTVDGGKSWKMYGEDADREPPFAVDLTKILGSRDGLIGFRMVVKSGVGLGDAPPTAGDQPDIWVELDRTPPMAQLLEVLPGQGTASGRILIKWRAEDRNLGAKPISLYFGVNGNWKPIAAQIANSGHYEWTLPVGEVPPQLRIGLDVVDEAGNRTFVQSDEITIDLSRPRARVTGIMPADGAVRR